MFFLRGTLGASTTVFGLVAGSWTAGMVLGSLIVPRSLRTHPVRSIMLSLAGACLAVMAAAGAPHALAVVPLWIVGGIFNAGLNVCLTVLVADRVPAWARGRAFAAQTAVIQGAGMIGYLVGGPLVDRFEPRPLVFAFGAAGLIAVLACLPVVRRAMRHGPPGAAVTQQPTPAGDSVGA